MKQKTYLQVSGLVFGIVAVIHLARLLVGFDVNFAGWSIPPGASVIGLIVAGYLSYSAFKLAK